MSNILILMLIYYKLVCKKRESEFGKSQQVLYVVFKITSIFLLAKLTHFCHSPNSSKNKQMLTLQILESTINCPLQSDFLFHRFQLIDIYIAYELRKSSYRSVAIFEKCQLTSKNSLKMGRNMAGCTILLKINRILNRQWNIFDSFWNKFLMNFSCTEAL